MQQNDLIMATLKERFRRWKETRSLWQKTTDVIFWLLLIMLIIPGPRKVISTAVNKVALNIKTPGIQADEKQAVLTDPDYNWVLAWSPNEPFYFSQVRDQVVFLNFWATWCPPCVAELPEIQKIYEKYGKKVTFLLVTNEDPAIVEAFMEKHGYQLPVLYMGTTPPGVFAHRALPTSFIISKDGRVVTKKTGAVNWDSRATYRIFDELLR